MLPASKPKQYNASAEWVKYRERGSVTLLRLMTFLSLRFGRRAGRAVLYAIAFYFFLFAPRARSASLEYLRRALGRRPGPADRFRQVMSFATTIHDRVYLLHDRFDLFNISVIGEDIVREQLRAGRGAFLIGAHIGSFEVIRAIARRQPGLRVAMVLYRDNAHKINSMLAAINPAAAEDTVALGTLEAMLKVQSLLDQGVFVGMLGDRTLGDEPMQTVRFLGASVLLPTGPMRAAALLRQPAILMLGLYLGGNRYEVVFEAIADFTAVKRPERESAIRSAVARYAERLEEHCRRNPYNWFNFFNVFRPLSGQDSRRPEADAPARDEDVDS